MANFEYEITKAIIDKKNAILTGGSIYSANEGRLKIDREWVLGSFMMGKLNKETLDTIDLQNRTFSGAVLTFMDSSPGGSYEINPRPQFTRYADIRVKGQLPGRGDVTIESGGGADAASFGHLSLGTGRYWYESQQETAQFVHFRMGVPEFNTMTQFFTSFYSEDAARVARTGRTGGLMSLAGYAVGTVLQFLSFRLLAAHAIALGLRFLFQKPASKFYYLRPDMNSYWRAVHGMVNQIAVNRGMLPITGPSSTGLKPTKPTDRNEMDEGAAAALNAAFPDLYSETGEINVINIVGRAQRMRNALKEKLWAELEKADTVDALVAGVSRQTAEIHKPMKSIYDKVSQWMKTEVGQVLSDEQAKSIEQTLRVADKDGKLPEKGYNNWSDYLKGEYEDGTEWLTFRVDNTNSVQESFSNNVVDSDLAQKFNSMSGDNKRAYFTFAGGNVAPVIGQLTGAVMDFAKGVLSSVGASGLVSLAGSAFVDIPKHWENSTTNMPRSSYSVTLISPYNNTMSQLTSIYIPMCCLLAAALPKSTGKQSYTWPYLIEYFDPGRAQSRLSMIDSLTIERGTSNLGFNKQARPLAVKLSWTMVELSNIVSMPIAAKFSLNPLDGVFDDDNLFTDYMNILASVSLEQQIYSSNRLKLRLAQRLRRYQEFFSKGNVTSMLHSWPIVGDLDILFKGTDRGSIR